ncbi:MAG: hypothetical protein ACXWYD_18600 [Candidatus Binatia bacterium]
MEIIIFELSAGLLLAAIVLLSRRQRAAAQKRGAVELERGEEPARLAALAQQACLNGLEKLHDSLSSLDQRTTAVERNLDSLMAAPLPERRQHYEAAALLLAAGLDGDRIAGVLGLPLAQVEMIGDLRRILGTGVKTNPEVEPPQPVRTAKRKALTRSAKARPQPVLLTDIVEAAHALNGAA